MDETKYCSGCGKEKLLTDFHRSLSAKDGRKSRCKKCRKLDEALSRVRRREQIREYQRRYRQENRALIKRRVKECRILKKREIESLKNDAASWREHIKGEIDRINKIQAEIDTWPEKAG